MPSTCDLQQRSLSLLWEQEMRCSAAQDMKHTAFGLLCSPRLQIFNEENFKHLLLPFFFPPLKHWALMPAAAVC